MNCRPTNVRQSYEYGMVLRVDVKEVPTPVQFQTQGGTVASAALGGLTLDKLLLCALLLDDEFQDMCRSDEVAKWEGGDEPYHDSYEGLTEDPDDE